MEESSEEIQELEEFSGYAEIDENVATSNTRSIYQIITDKIAPADVTSIEDESEEEEEGDTTQILPVTNAFDHVNDLRRLIAFFATLTKRYIILIKLKTSCIQKTLKM